MRFFSRARQPMSSYASSLADTGHADHHVQSRKWTSRVIPAIRSLSSWVAIRIVAIFLSFVLAALLDYGPCHATLRDCYAPIAQSSQLRGEGRQIHAIHEQFSAMLGVAPGWSCMHVCSRRKSMGRFTGL